MRVVPSGSSAGGEGEPVKVGPTKSHVYLNVYDLTPVNNYLYWFGLGIFHSGIEVHGMEYGFGAHEHPTSGVFEVEPKSCPGFIFRRSVWLGTTDLTCAEFRSFIEHLAGEYHGDTYHLIAKNCNHFTDDVCMRLTGKGIPGWVNRLARLGSLCNCLLPEAIHATTVGRLPEHLELSDGRKSGHKVFVAYLHNMYDFVSCSLTIDVKNNELDGSESVASSTLVESDDDEELDHHLLKTSTSPRDRPLRLARDVIG